MMGCGAVGRSGMHNGVGVEKCNRNVLLSTGRAVLAAVDRTLERISDMMLERNVT
jgi:hypothetical protein